METSGTGTTAEANKTDAIDDSIPIIPDTQQAETPNNQAEKPAVIQLEEQTAASAMCISGCTSGEVGDMARCCMCAHWYYTACMHLSDEEAIGVWQCPQCRTVTADLKATMLTVGELKTTINEIKKVIKKQPKTVNFQCDFLVNDVKSLVSRSNCGYQ